MSGLKDDRGRMAGIGLAVVLAVIAVVGVVYEVREAPPAPAPAPAAAPAPAPAVPASAPRPAPAAADADHCSFPGPVPALPRGEIATPEDMKTQHDAIQGFVKALEAYQDCETQQSANAPAGTDEQLKQHWIALGNRAVDDAHALANAYAEQLKIYHERHPEPLPAK
ncbi:MAG: hypothetical protein WDN69_26685 [Aliidongia sp.]